MAQRTLQELVLIRSSLLAGERMDFLSGSLEGLLDAYAASDQQVFDERLDQEQPRFMIHVDGADVSFEVDYAEMNGVIAHDLVRCVKVRGGNGASRTEVERWKERVKEQVASGDFDTEFPVYQLISLHLLPLLHDELDVKLAHLQEEKAPRSPPQARSSDQLPYHVLFTSHHLVSPTKRRSMSQWSSSLNIAGFAKIGYPGIIYAQGAKEDIEQFVDNVKGMQWLALKTRFVEALKEAGGENRNGELKGWKEFERVGEVVEVMRRLGRGKYVLEMGIGAGS